MQYAQLPPAKIEYHGIRFTPEGMSRSMHGEPLQFFAKKDVLDIRLHKAIRAEAPLIQGLGGLLLIGLGAYPLYKLLEGVILGKFARGLNLTHWYLVGVLLLPLGIWLVAAKD